MTDKPTQAFSSMQLSDLPDKLREAVARAEWSSLMPVQSMAIPYLLKGRDIMVQSRTGSGKTGAFVLPLLKLVDTAKAKCQALILVPTRELARQVAGETELLTGDSGVRSVAVFGGVGYGHQISAFRKGAHIVIGTPGRILDHLLKGTLTLEGLKVLIFDEADRMLSMGFYPDMREVQRYLPRKRILSSMFSATYPQQVLRLARQFLHDPETLSLSRDHVHVTETAHISYKVPSMEKDRCLVRIIEIENPTQAIIFCNTRMKVHYVSTVLQRFGYNADELSSDLSQGARERKMARLRSGELRFLVATDVAARGIDIPELSHVFIYEPPEDVEDYIHRAGRTGRAGSSGIAISLLDPLEEIAMDRIAKRYNIDVEMRPLPDEKDVANLVSQRAVALLEAKLRARDNLQKERMGRFMPLAKELGESDDELALMAMLIDDFYQGSFHATFEMDKPSSPSKAKSSKRRSSRKKSSSGQRRPKRKPNRNQ
jgi:ATP-dependent RNA helicase DeaD